MLILISDSHSHGFENSTNWMRSSDNEGFHITPNHAENSAAYMDTILHYFPNRAFVADELLELDILQRAIEN